MADAESLLVTEQLARMQDRLNARIAALENELAHYRQLDGERHAVILQTLERLENTHLDHETRLRAASDGMLRFQVFAGLAGLAGGGGLLRSFFP